MSNWYCPAIRALRSKASVEYSVTEHEFALQNARGLDLYQEIPNENCPYPSFKALASGAVFAYGKAHQAEAQSSLNELELLEVSGLGVLLKDALAP